MMNQILHVTDVKVLPQHCLRIAFNNGVVGIVDLSSELDGEVFESLKDPTKFREVMVGYGTVVWPGDIDLAPEYLYRRLVEQGGGSPAAMAHDSGSLQRDEATFMKSSF